MIKKYSELSVLGAVLNNSQITANDFGPGGNITIVADVFLASQDSSVTASSTLSEPGTVDIRAAFTNISGFLEPLPENIFQATSLLQQSCAARFSGGKLSSFVVAGRDGMPLEPGGFMPSPLYRLAGQQSSVAVSGQNLSQDSNTITSWHQQNGSSLSIWPCTSNVRHYSQSSSCGSF